MKTLEKQYMVDVGGGPDWQPQWGHGEWVLNLMKESRISQLAQKDPLTRYIVIDQYIPKPEAKTLHEMLPNVYFIEHKITKPFCLPFPDKSVNRIELNHMWTPIAAVSRVAINEELRAGAGSTDYLYVLKESCRVLKSSGVLSMTEKEDRLKKIRFTLSADSYLNLDGLFMSRLGLDMNPETQVLTKIIDPNRSDYTHSAFRQGVDVYNLILRKK